MEMASDREPAAPLDPHVPGAPLRPVSGVVQSLKPLLVGQLLLSVAFTVATAFISPLSAIVSLVVVPPYAWIIYRTTKPRMQAMASRARPVADPVRQSKPSLVIGRAVRFLLLTSVTLALFLWTARDDSPSWVVGGIISGSAVSTFLQVRWWQQWEERYGAEMLYESGWSWREFWKGADDSKCWFVPARRNEAEATMTAPAVTGDDGQRPRADHQHSPCPPPMSLRLDHVEVTPAHR